MGTSERDANITDKRLRRILKLYNARDSLSVHDIGTIFNNSSIDLESDVSYLVRKGYLKILPSYKSIHNIDDNDLPIDAPLYLTTEGRVAMNREFDGIKYRRFNEIRAWLSIILSLVAIVISIIALVISAAD